MKLDHFRNISIIAHVDHGKTTLVDWMLRQSGQFHAVGEATERVMDSMDLERERGLTILAKNTSIRHRGVKINIVDTPGHADFGGEVERALAMVDGAILLVDASEGPLPQTRFVLEKALAKPIPVVVVVNKIDRPDARPRQVLDEIYDLFIDLAADEAQLEFPVLYAIGKEGRATFDLEREPTDLRPLLDTIVDVLPGPEADPDGSPQFLAAMLDYDDFVGRLALGRLHAGSLVRGGRYTHCGAEGNKIVRLTMLYAFEGLDRKPVELAEAGDIVAVAGIEGVTIGDSLADALEPRPLPRLHVDEPTVSVLIGINDGPFSGHSGDRLTSRQIRERLFKETEHNVSIRVAMTGTSEAYQVYGRGELQLGVLIEIMRREGFEMTVSKPQVVEKEDGLRRLEPFERVVLDLPEDMIGVATERMGRRQGRLLEMSNRGSGRVRMIYRVPSRGLIGFRFEFLQETRGLGVINTLFDGWDTRKGEIPRRPNGALVGDRGGRVTAYAVDNLQSRGALFVRPGDQVYEGMVVGEHSRPNDLNVNIVRERKLTNIRAASADDALVLNAARSFSLEQAIEWIDEDELVEVTPEAIRIRKRTLASGKRSVRRT